MDSFEQVVAEILWNEGFWVRTSVKVELTKEEKKKIGKPSSPRWEIDVVAYKAKSNLLRIVECKSYLDSVGVQAAGFGPKSKKSARYKLFNDKLLLSVISNRLSLQLTEKGFCRSNPKIQLCLACGKIKKGDRPKLGKIFGSKNWELWDEEWFREKLNSMANNGYENQISSVVAKLLLRGGKRA